MHHNGVSVVSSRHEDQIQARLDANSAHGSDGFGEVAVRRLSGPPAP